MSSEFRAIEAFGLLEDGDIDLAEAAFALAAADRPSTDLTPHRRDLTRIVAAAAGVLDREAGTAGRIAGIAALLTFEGFAGDTATYDDPRNADLSHVLERRRGLPVTLALLWTVLLRRNGWAAKPLGMPGHVLLRVGRDPAALVIDAFDDGRVLGAEAVGALVARMAGANARVEADHLAGMTNRATLVRMVTNQAARARQGGDTRRALTLYRRMTALAPEMANLWWERARLEQLLGEAAAARGSLIAMLEVARPQALRNRIDAALAALAGTAR